MRASSLLPICFQTENVSCVVREVEVAKIFVLLLISMSFACQSLAFFFFFCSLKQYIFYTARYFSKIVTQFLKSSTRSFYSKY